MIPLNTFPPTENAIPTSDVAGVTPAAVPVAAPVAAVLAELATEAADEATEDSLEATLEAADVPAAEAELVLVVILWIYTMQLERDPLYRL